MLNSLFGHSSFRLFEEIQTGALGLFHDSVDVMFDSKDYTSKFNIFDFQGFACTDHLLIEGLLRELPCSILFIQLTDIDYIDNTLSKISENVRMKYAKNIFILQRLEDPSKIRKVIKNFGTIFGEEFDEETQIFDFGNITAQ